MKRYKPIYSKENSVPFKEVISLNCIFLIVDKYLIRIYSEPVVKKQKKGELLEQTKKKLCGVYSAIEHQPHVFPQGDYTIHVLQKDKEIFTLNRKGTAHDQSHGFLIHNKVYKALQTYFPDYKLPANKIIEYYSNTNSKFQFLYG